MDMDADGIIIKLDRISERRIQDAMQAGEFDNLKGKGQPLQYEENPFVPPDMRAAYTVLANSGNAPDWMVLAQEIEEDLQKMRETADRHFAYLRRQLQLLATDYSATRRLRPELTRLKAEHHRAAAQHVQAIEAINRKINTFNQTVPIASLFKVPLSVTSEMKRYEDRVPAYLSYA